MSLVVGLDSAEALDAGVTGGKGSSLARMVGARFPVPGGFVISTHAYRSFVEEAGLWPSIEAELAAIDFGDAAGVETSMARVRALIENAPIPASIADEIRRAYADLGADSYVAVRSSGTAEDLADASFAGQHDTYLDVHGDDDLLDAVRRCWGSLWTSRATAYRDRGGFAQDEVALAVVVQLMIESEVSGVMFTANPMSTAVDEFVINASYGLGEGIVSGILTPDQFTVDRDTYAVIDEIIGAKEKQVVRSTSGRHTEIVAVEPERTGRAALDPAEIADLARLGARVMQYYDGWPQDIEWALVDGQFYLLQSRDVTGVDFTWDEDLEDYMPELPRIARDEVLTRAFADSVWQGKITPMGYSLRCEAFHPMITKHQNIWGTPEIADIRIWKYAKGEVYYTGRQEFLNMVAFLPPVMWNPALLGFTQPSLIAELEKQDGSWFGYAKALARIRLLDPDLGPYRFFDNCYRQMREDGARMLGPSVEELQAMSDKEVARAVDRAIKNQHDWVEDLWSGFFLHATTLSAVFAWMLGNWYKGTNPHIFNDLITGLPEPTITLKENLQMWELAELIRNSDELSTIFDEHPGAEFFGVVAESPAGAEFMEKYREFLADFGHRGHADRDISYPRRLEDPTVDYNSLKAFLSADGNRPGSNEEKLIAQREAATEEALASIRKQPLGSLKAEAFSLVHNWLLRFFVFRDDERHHTDRGTWGKKQSVKEVGRRLAERGILDDADDYMYLSKRELMRLFEGGGDGPRVTRAKVQSRRGHVQNYRADGAPPMFILGNGTVTTDGEEAASGFVEEGLLRGVGTSRGHAVGTARVIAEQKDLHRVEKGDILITHSTDPGWTTVFLILQGLVLETGGMLAHGSCISREYGIPAIQINDAMRYIPDGAKIDVNGDTGEVRILELPQNTESEGA